MINSEHSPRQRVMEWKSQLPSIWRQVEKERRQWRPGIKGWPPHVFLPFDRAMAATREAWCEEGVIPRHQEGSYQMGLTTQALAGWRMTQGIYRIDPTLYQDLINTRLTGEIPVDVLRHMPEWCVYITTPGMTVPSPGGRQKAVVGLWYWLDGEPLELRIGIDVGRPPPISNMRVPVKGLALEKQAFIQASTKEALSADYNDSGRAWLSSAISLILFICTQAEEIQSEGGPANPQLRKTRRGNIKMFAANGPTIWNVGVRLGTALRAAYARLDAESSHDTGGGQSVRPHVRRAHWHTFLTGPRDGERRRSLRWLPPIPVGIEDYDALPAVIRDVG